MIAPLFKPEFWLLEFEFIEQSGVFPIPKLKPPNALWVKFPWYGPLFWWLEFVFTGIQLLIEEFSWLTELFEP